MSWGVSLQVYLAVSSSRNGHRAGSVPRLPRLPPQSRGYQSYHTDGYHGYQGYHHGHQGYRGEATKLSPKCHRIAAESPPNRGDSSVLQWQFIRSSVVIRLYFGGDSSIVRWGFGASFQAQLSSFQQAGNIQIAKGRKTGLEIAQKRARNQPDTKARNMPRIPTLAAPTFSTHTTHTDREKSLHCSAISHGGRTSRL